MPLGCFFLQFNNVSPLQVASTTHVANSREQVGTNQVRARLGLPPVAGIARGFMSQGPASLPANAEKMPVYQGTAAGRVGSPTTRADSPGGGRVPAGYNSRRTESPPIDLQGASRIPRPGQQGAPGARKPLPPNAYGHGQGKGQALAPPLGSASRVGSRVSDVPSFEIDGKASYYAPGMQVDSRENSVYDQQSSRNGHGAPHHPNSSSRFSPPPVRNAGGRIASQDRDLPPPPPPPQEDDNEEEEFEVIPDTEDVNGLPDISTPPPVPRKSPEPYSHSAATQEHTRPMSALSSDSGLGLPRESTDSIAAGGMQSSLFRTEAQELRARWTAQEKEKEERERRQRQKAEGISTAPRANGAGYFDRRKGSVGTYASSTAASSDVETPVIVHGGVGRDSLYMSEGEFGGMRGDMGTSTNRKRRGRTKSMIAREREREEHDMARAAAEAVARKKWEKEQRLREEMEEEERKKVS